MGILGVLSSWFRGEQQKKVSKMEPEPYLDLSVFGKREGVYSGETSEVVIVKNALPESCERYLGMAKKGILVILNPIVDPEEFARYLQECFEKEGSQTLKGCRVTFEVGRELIIIFDERVYSVRAER